MNTFSGLKINDVLLFQSMGTPALSRTRSDREGLVNVLTEKMKLQEDNDIFSHCPLVSQSDTIGTSQTRCASSPNDPTSQGRLSKT